MVRIQLAVGEQRLGLLGVIAIMVGEIGWIGPGGGGDWQRGQITLSMEGQLIDRLPVDGIVQRLTHRLGIERRVLEVDGQRRIAGAEFVMGGGQFRLLLQGGDIGVADPDDHIGRARLQVQQSRLIIEDRLTTRLCSLGFPGCQ